VDPIVVRSLTREYRIAASDPDLRNSLVFLDARPEIVGRALTIVTVEARSTPDGFELALPGGRELRKTVPAAWNRIAALIFEGIQEEAPSAPLVHGATLLSPNGERIIVVGPKGAGKSTLTLHLLLRGYAFEGDEHVVIRDADVVARARRLRIKPGSLPLVPRFADAILRSPTLRDDSGMSVYAVDPTVFGAPWRISTGLVSRLIFITPNHGGRSAFTRMDGDEAFRALAEHCLLPAEQRAAAASRLRQLAIHTPAWRLALGDLDEAERGLRA
jgi:hypothetical protein